MNISGKLIDNGASFDFGKTSKAYGQFRDIYPREFYDKITERGLCLEGQKILDIGTGTGVLPRNMYASGGKWTGTDISEAQITEAKRLSVGMDIDYLACPTENLNFPNGSFDVITACQCFWYFDHNRVMPILHRLLNENGSILILYMAWLPHEDIIAAQSEKLVLKYNPNWTGAGEVCRPIDIPPCYFEKFKTVYHEEYPISVHFTRESWNGRMKTCRGIGASLSPREICSWESEHMKLLNEIAPDEFDVLHYAAVAQLRKK